MLAFLIPLFVALTSFIYLHLRLLPTLLKKMKCRSWKLKTRSWRFLSAGDLNFLQGSGVILLPLPHKILKFNITQKGPIFCLQKVGCSKKIVFYHSSDFWIFSHNQRSKLVNFWNLVMLKTVIVCIFSQIGRAHV